MKNYTFLHNICYFIKMALKNIVHFQLSFLYLIIRMWSKKENIWVFCSHTGDVFKDNTKYYSSMLQLITQISKQFGFQVIKS
jgi:hypothetical protein